MKPQFLQTFADTLETLSPVINSDLLGTLGSLRDTANQFMPDDPATPTGLNVINTYGTDPLAIELGWDDVPSGWAAVLEYKGAEGNAAGPQGWQPITINSTPATNGMKATLMLNNPDGQNIIFRLSVQRPDGVQSEPCDPIAFPLAE